MNTFVYDQPLSFLSSLQNFWGCNTAKIYNKAPDSYFTIFTEFEYGFTQMLATHFYHMTIRTYGNSDNIDNRVLQNLGSKADNTCFAYIVT